MFKKFRRKSAEPPRSDAAKHPTRLPSDSQVAQAPRGPTEVQRSPTCTSTLSSFNQVEQQRGIARNEDHVRERSRARHADPLGLHVVFEPENDPTLNLIFVHGLGGTSRQTWSRDRDTDKFWPREWLPHEPGFEATRILSFGYNAHFASSGRDNILNIGDFAKDLLFAMKYGVNENAQGFQIDRVPVVFVVHSMGGLVVKKAYILGRNDPQYSHLIGSVRAIVFLATPHRGTNLADVLNKILSVSVFNHSAKQYIGELKQNSPALQDINEQFRNVAPNLQIASFYETQATSVGPKKLMVLERDSSILGYPNEISKALDADHHNVCKYTDKQDPNYVSVRDLLRSLLSTFAIANPSPQTQDVDSPDMDPRLIEYLGVVEMPADDLDFYRSRWMPGSCEWIHSDPSFLAWLDDQHSSCRALWIHGVPGAGKSVLSSYIVEYLRDMKESCQYYFFRSGDHQKRSISALLRSLALQTALSFQSYRTQLIENMGNDSPSLEKAEARLIWQRLFAAGLFKCRSSRRLYWIIDGLDECDAPQQLLNMFTGVAQAQVPLRIIFVGRQSVNFQRTEDSMRVDTLCVDTTTQDLERYVTKELEYIPGLPEFKQRICKKILDNANGNFLWVSLVLKDIAQCHTESAIEETLDELPADLEPLYHRMESNLASSSRPSDRDLSRSILAWATCARRPLNMMELSQALTPEYPNLLDVTRTAAQVCGGFVAIDNKGHLVMIHQTAREYLTKTPGLQYSIVPRLAHRELFVKCIRTLSSLKSNFKLSQISSQPFVLYASTSWAYHLMAGMVALDHMQTILLNHFFGGQVVLTWIWILASTNQLRYLIYASKAITSYVLRQARLDSESSPLTQRLREKECLESWAIDLMKIVGKFGSNLIQYPNSIYRLIPAFCPEKSMLRRQFGPKKNSTFLRFSGFLSQAWDDCLAKISLAKEGQPIRVTCNDTFFAILIANGDLLLFSTVTYDLVRRLVHGERVLCFNFDVTWERLVTYGFKQTKVWDVSSGDVLCLFANPSSAKALSISFSTDKAAIYTCSDDRAIRSVSLNSLDHRWITNEIAPGGLGYNGRQYNSPRRVAFSADGAQVAISYRGFPLLVWKIEPPGVLGHCERLTDRSKSLTDLWTEIGPICWNPITGHVLGLYADGCIFKWHPMETDSYELKTIASDIRCSPNGDTFVTSGIDGTLRIWNFHHFALIYSLSCHTPVTDLAISPDGTRIYDLRDIFCNVWEPNALIRLTETSDEVSDSSSTLGGFPQASEASIELLPPITALAINPQNKAYCVGDDAGSSRIHLAGENRAMDISQTFMPVEHAKWSEDGLILVTADLGSTIRIWSSETPVGKDSLRLKSDINLGKPILQLLVNSTINRLLITLQDSVELWSLDGLSMGSYKNAPLRCCWITHPKQQSLILRIGTDQINAFHWNDFAVLGYSSMSTLVHCTEDLALQSSSTLPPWNNSQSDGTDKPDLIEQALVASDGAKMLVQMHTSSDRGRSRPCFARLPVDALPTTNSSDSPKSIAPSELPFTVSDRIQKILGLVPHGTVRSSMAGIACDDDIVFLDTAAWICSWPFGDDATSTVKRHFFLPQDWLNAESIELSTIATDGTIYIPRNGEIAVIMNGLRETWPD